MSIQTKKVAGRRKLSFHTLDEVVADATCLVASPGARMLGNWPLDRLLTHLATAVNASIDGIDAQGPLVARLLGPLIKRRIFRHGMSPGFKLPKKFEGPFFPEVASNQAGLEILCQAVGRLQNERMTARHPILGKLTHEEWTRLHLRHAELHLGFAVPG